MADKSTRSDQATPADVGAANVPQPMPVDHSFTLQAIMELQKSTGELKECVKSLTKSLDRQESKLDEIGQTVNGINMKVYAAGVVLTIVVGIGAFVVNKAIDFGLDQISTSQASDE